MRSRSYQRLTANGSKNQPQIRRARTDLPSRLCQLRSTNLRADQSRIVSETPVETGVVAGAVLRARSLPVPRHKAAGACLLSRTNAASLPVVKR